MAALYRIYRRATPTASPTLVDTVPAGTLQYTLTGLANNSTGYYFVKAVTAQGVEDRDAPSPRMALAAIDGAGLLILPAPAAPIHLTAVPTAGGGIHLAWQQVDLPGGVNAASFHVYVGVNGAVNYSIVALTVTAGGSGMYSADLGPYSTGDVVTVVVRAVSAPSNGAIEENNTAAVTATADATAPAPLTALAVEVAAE